ncbi:uncharacterized protein MONOS_5307 [Monocercomonoides exilis]|uniref:uncharacterized protein n=1 Tax=Monocercomonoides exilis TaxID=2049356 RepID=UPI00355A96BB|nr:hypothetical protein MONOS_5307 [Monocercomonoides exilis]|eukprot:MONOS_5307.1-p1 / transcript=MONOS_5307.1 / gene=MONOS_5307 / organism=Monocercomonoides_exilis_PA203 / gene_product=unspecified product / transcript_product=unspecified product / location=Mono_scaffold00153:17129-17772(-) / protein_length=114 / sequence_SO=supercontig / SO=protein_coding / is_pseudo=false
MSQSRQTEVEETKRRATTAAIERTPQKKPTSKSPAPSTPKTPRKSSVSQSPTPNKAATRKPTKSPAPTRTSAGSKKIDKGKKGKSMKFLYIGLGLVAAAAAAAGGYYYYTNKH